MGVAKRAKLPIILLTLIAVLGGFWIVDSVIATRTEAQISRQVRAEMNLDVTPSVYVGGMPYTKALLSKEISTVAVSISDVENPEFGMISTSAEATDVTVTSEQVFNGDIAGANAQLLTQTTGLDAVAVGKQLDIADLDISNAYDISPAGSNAAEVQLRGTLDGDDTPVTISANLRLQGAQFTLQPTAVRDSSGSKWNNAEIMDAFQWSFDTHDLMGSRQAAYVYVNGGTIYFESQERNVEIQWEDFALDL